MLRTDHPFTYVIGDVHGCYDELVELVERWICPTRTTRLIFVGDLVDKGPDSAGVVRYIRHNLVHRCRVDVVFGNHELKHVRYATRAERKGSNVMQVSDEFRAVHATLRPDDIAWFKTFPTWIRLPEHKQTLVVHGGIARTMERLGDPFDHTSKLAHVRYVSKKGRPVSEDKIRAEGGAFWTAQYRGAYGHVIYGHQPYLNATQPVRTHKTTGIDLACCYGNRLYALGLPHGYGPHSRFIRHAFVCAQTAYVEPSSDWL